MPTRVRSISRDGVADALLLVDGVRIADDAVLRPLDRGDLGDLRPMSPARKPRSMTPMPPSSASTIAIAARVIVSMLAETSGRLSVRCSVNRAVRSIDGRIAARDDAELRREQKVVERAASNQGQEIHVGQSQFTIYNLQFTKRLSR